MQSFIDNMSDNSGKTPQSIMDEAGVVGDELAAGFKAKS